MQKWKKLGLIFDPTDRFDWMQTHATTPMPVHLEGDVYRVFFSTRNKLNQNQTAFVDIDINNPKEILNISKEPVFTLGKLGHFDCDGVYATCIIRVGDKLYLYYGGWNAGQRGLFYSHIGLAISEDNGLSFKRVSQAPILNRDDIDPLSLMAPFVIKEENIWKMWYASGIKYYYENNILRSFYTVKYAESDDGIKWRKSGITSLDLGDKDSNIARASIYKENGKYVAWYPVVSKELGSYRIGYGESKDGKVFERMDEKVTLTTSDSGWDSQAVTYPLVMNHNDKYYLFYNGNQFGKDGFGIAVSG
ncbi:hypothetical protein [Aliarcobacter cryaerophilus]|uniref:Glycosyl hydrolase family 32 N-terminal domain-containing protein n=1 Tax=Aliarcobacter cryaerophilus TaxID=28198 RepID=A0A2S9TRC3_9BACT|nr:hypothetical protein [Aliarcobacter cryaerophilus]PRN01354.1 hypothetical protein CJ668_02485 [Arcobacter cryaerophilus gv. pseudocryaerophilus]